MQLTVEPSPQAQETAVYLMQSFIAAAEGDMERAAELANLYIDGMNKNSDMTVRETAQCLQRLTEATAEIRPKYLT